MCGIKQVNDGKTHLHSESYKRLSGGRSKGKMHSFYLIYLFLFDIPQWFSFMLSKSHIVPSPVKSFVAWWCICVPRPHHRFYRQSFISTWMLSHGWEFEPADIPVCHCVRFCITSCMCYYDESQLPVGQFSWV